MTTESITAPTVKLSIRARRVLTELVKGNITYPAWELAWETARQHNARVSDRIAAEYFEAVQELAQDTNLADWIDNTRNEDAVQITDAGREFASTMVHRSVR
jgi:hypothetical protein